MRIWTILLAVGCVFAAQLGCGGSQKPPKKGSFEDCKARVKKILDQEAVCDPLAFETHEKEVMSWQKQCIAHAEPEEKSKVEVKIENDRTCTEEQRQLNTWKEQCSNRVKQVSERKDCNGIACVADLEEIKRIIKEC